MAKISTQESTSTPHQAIINERKQMEISGISEICAFDENQVHLKTNCGSMRISGKGLRVMSLLPEESKALIEGAIDSVTYSNFKAHKPFGKLFG